MRTFFEVIIVFVLAIGSVVLYHMYAGTVQQFLFGPAETYTIRVGHTPVTVTVARTLAEQERGLSGTATLPASAGKLFIFDNPGPQGIWMKDMNYPIDILWFGPTGRLVHLEEGVATDTYPTVFSAPVPAQFVLEVNAGFTQQHRLQLGDQLMVPKGLVNSTTGS